MNKIKFFKSDPNAIKPVKGTPGSVGWDIFSIENVILDPRERKAIRTGIKLELPKGTYGRLAPRSGMALKACVDVMGGVIDPDYTGEVKVILCNNSKDIYIVGSGDKIAQLIIEQYMDCEAEFSENSDKLASTSRGDNGFGSTGI